MSYLKFFHKKELQDEIDKLKFELGLYQEFRKEIQILMEIYNIRQENNRKGIQNDEYNFDYESYCLTGTSLTLKSFEEQLAYYGKDVRLHMKKDRAPPFKLVKDNDKKIIISERKCLTWHSRS